jgi:glycosyltransferase involved in cell wall biosynthesis/4-amino-4-deoxy-L-arabinose transferase-like glycosyltransferase
MLVNIGVLRFHLSSWRRTLMAIFAAALIIRVVFVLTLKDGFYFPDSVDYSSTAVNLLVHGEFGETYGRAPVYPLFLAGIYVLFGQKLAVIRMVEALLGAGLAVVIAIMARRIDGKEAGILAGLLWSIYPTGIFITGLVYPTNVATILLACAMLCMVTKAHQELAPSRVVLGGILFGCAALTVPVVLATILVVSLWLMYWQGRQRLLLVSLFLLGTAVPLTPWTVRNFEVHGRLVIIEPRLVTHLPRVPNDQNPSERQKGDPKVNAILANPGVFAMRFAREFGYFWELSPHRIVMTYPAVRETMHEGDARIVRETVFGTSWTSLVSILSAGPLFLFALIGTGAMWFTEEQRRALSLLCCTILSFAIGYSFFFGKMRYRIPIEPYLVILGAYGLRQIWLLLTRGFVSELAPDGDSTRIRPHRPPPRNAVESPVGQSHPLSYSRDIIAAEGSGGVAGGVQGSPPVQAIATGPSSPSVSMIVPVYNNPRDLRECLAALIASAHPDAEIIVVDDASTDDTPSVAAQMGVHVLQLAKNSGPAVARNYGASQAQGDILFFVDADVVIASDAVRRVVQLFTEHPDLTAVFGSYDARPRAQGIVSQYRNLLHHFVHQNGNPEASTFWAGCGAIRRSVFREVGGFDGERFPRSSIEDIELGYRLRRAGHRILLDKALQGTHLKRWTLRSVIRTDILHRAIPWSRLILESKKAPDDLNLTGGQRLSIALVGLACIALLLAVFRFELIFLSGVAIIGVMILNRQLFAFLSRQHGFFFATLSIPLHLLHYLYSGLGYLYVWVAFQLKSVMAPSVSPPREGSPVEGGEQTRNPQ